MDASPFETVTGDWFDLRIPEYFRCKRHRAATEHRSDDWAAVDFLWQDIEQRRASLGSDLARAHPQAHELGPRYQRCGGSFLNRWKRRGPQCHRNLAHRLTKE